MGSNQRTVHSDWIFASVVKKKMALPLIDITSVILVLILGLFFLPFLKTEEFKFSLCFSVQKQNHLSYFPPFPPQTTLPILMFQDSLESHGCGRMPTSLYHLNRRGSLRWCLCLQKSFWEARGHIVSELTAVPLCCFLFTKRVSGL